MGIVYAAIDTRLGDLPVAIKVLPPELLHDQKARSRLKKEALAALALSHPGIVRLLGYEEDGATVFLVLELLSGPTLGELALESPDERLDFAQVVGLLSEVAPALDYAHEQGIVHRDVKPSNLMIHREGDRVRVKVTDFGVAAQVRDSMTRMTGLEPAGTLDYVAPEQLTGARPDARSDQYALAATVYELLSGDPPFMGAGLSQQILHGTPRPLPGLPGSASAAILRALAKDPAARFPSCRAFAEAIAGAAAGPDPAVPGPGPRPEPTPPRAPPEAPGIRFLDPEPIRPAGPPARARQDPDPAPSPIGDAARGGRLASTALIDDMARATGLPRDRAELVVDAFWAVVADELRQRLRFCIPNFGTFRLDPPPPPPAKPEPYFKGFFKIFPATPPAPPPSRPRRLRFRFSTSARRRPIDALPLREPAPDSLWVARWSRRIDSGRDPGPIAGRPDGVSIRRQVAFAIHRRTRLPLPEVVHLLERMLRASLFVFGTLGLDLEWARRGVFRSRLRPAGQGRDPRTHARYARSESRQVSFRPAPGFLRYLTGNSDRAPVLRK